MGAGSSNGERVGAHKSLTVGWAIFVAASHRARARLRFVGEREDAIRIDAWWNHSTDEDTVIVR